MAMDTAAKRRSALNTVICINQVLPIADASIDSDDRITVANLYEGISLSAASVSSRRVRSIAAIVSRRKRVSKRRSR